MQYDVTIKTLTSEKNFLILDKSHIKWRKHPDMTIAFDWDVKHQFKQTNKKGVKIHVIGNLKFISAVIKHSDHAIQNYQMNTKSLKYVTSILTNIFLTSLDHMYMKTNCDDARDLDPVVQSIVSLTISLGHKFVKQISAKVTNTLLFFVEKM